ncbi:MAG: hypothetical protein AMXMBFR33_59140 [Candidatus Xenobia bacterium]|jgi:hypothetical protein
MSVISNNPTHTSYGISDYGTGPAAAPTTPSGASAGPEDGFTPSAELSEEGGIGGCGTEASPCGGESSKGDASSDSGASSP